MTAWAMRMPGVIAVITGEHMLSHGKPFITGVKVDAPQYALATDRVRYVGEPVAIVIATDRYLAEDALDGIDADYSALPPVIDPQQAAQADTIKIHPDAPGNLLHQRDFRYGDPEVAFKNAAHIVETTIHYPRNSCTPIECFNVVAEHFPAGEQPDEDRFEVTANFQGPYTLHTVMARALNVSGNRLRLKTPPNSDGSYGVKQAVFPYIVALAIAAKIAGRPVKWVEDRLEHLTAATSSTNRVTRLKGAFDKMGRLLALDYNQLEDCGAYLRAPEPATIYRMHGNMTGAYAVENLAIQNRVVVTNKTPTGLNRGFGGPQVYFPLERLMDLAATELAIDPLEIRRRNLVPSTAMPYRTASGALLDSGDYAASLSRACKDGGLQDLLESRDRARAQGRFFGIGYCAAVEPSISNMGYITTLLTPQQREKSGAKNGALATATVSFDPSGSITVNTASVPQGQGHQTVLAQVVADVFGVDPAAIVVTTDHDTNKDSWSIASGNYSSRFAGAVAGAAHKAAMKLRQRLAIIAAAELGIQTDDVVFSNGRLSAIADPDNNLSLTRTAAKAHWSPLSIPDEAGSGLRETAIWTLPELSEPDRADKINSSGCHGFIFDICAVEIDAVTCAVKIHKYITMHDAGRLLNPMLADGQIKGGFAHGLGAALYEELSYDADGGFLSGTLVDYLPPTAWEIPELVILHDESPSPFTPLGAKGLGEGNCMSTPVCIANAVADALQIDITRLPLTRSRVADLLAEEEPENTLPPGKEESKSRDTGRSPQGHALQGNGSTLVPAPPRQVWSAIIDEGTLQKIVPGCHEIKRTGDNAFQAEVTFGVGPVKGRFQVKISLEDMMEPESLRLVGGATGPLGIAQGEASVTLTEVDTGTRVDYSYSVSISGKVAAVGGV